MGANFRELIGRDLSASLETDYHETPVDRVGAFSKGARLGTLLWRLKYGLDMACLKPASFLLAKEVQLESEIGIRVCELAISEWLLPECEVCRGAKEVLIGPKLILCPGCDGFGVRRYEYWERDRFLRRGKSPEELHRFRKARFRPWIRKYAKAVAVLTKHSLRINPTMNAELER